MQGKENQNDNEFEYILECLKFVVFIAIISLDIDR